MMTMSNIEREYKYKPPWMGILLGVVFFGFCAVISGVQAQSNDHGFIILSAYQVTIFWWIVCAFSLGFVLMAGVVAVRSLIQKQRIAFTPASIIVPKSRWSQKEQIIEYKKIKSFLTAEEHGQHFLHVFHADGKYTIVASMLPSRAAFDELYKLLAKKTQHAKEDSRA